MTISLIDVVLSTAVLILYAALYHVSYHLHAVKQALAVLLHAMAEHGVIDLENDL